MSRNNRKPQASAVEQRSTVHHRVRLRLSVKQCSRKKTTTLEVSTEIPVSHHRNSCGLLQRLPVIMGLIFSIYLPANGACLMIPLKQRLFAILCLITMMFSCGCGP